MKKKSYATIFLFLEGYLMLGRENMEKKEYTSPYDFEGKIPLKQAIILMFTTRSSNVRW